MFKHNYKHNNKNDNDSIFDNSSNDNENDFHKRFNWRARHQHGWTNTATATNKHPATTRIWRQNSTSAGRMRSLPCIWPTGWTHKIALRLHTSTLFALQTHSFAFDFCYYNWFSFCTEYLSKLDTANNFDARTICFRSFWWCYKSSRCQKEVLICGVLSFAPALASVAFRFLISYRVSFKTRHGE